MIKLLRHTAIAIALSTSSIAMAENSGWTLSQTDGQISVIRDGKALYGAEGTQLKIGDIVKASKAARAILVRGNNTAILSPNGQIRITKPQTKGAVAQALEFIGDLVSSDTKKSNFNRPTHAAVVKGFGDETDLITDGS